MTMNGRMNGRIDKPTMSGYADGAAPDETRGAELPPMAHNPQPMRTVGIGSVSGAGLGGQTPMTATTILSRFVRKNTLRQNAGRDERLVAALCHVTILLNTVTFVGGIVVCAGLYLYCRTRALYAAEQASRALIYQCGVWGIIVAGWMFYRLLPDWTGFVFVPLGALVWTVAIVRAMWRAGRCL